MVGIKYLVNEKGRKTAAVIDLDIYGDVWEDIQDILVVESRLSYNTTCFFSVKGFY